MLRFNQVFETQFDGRYRFYKSCIQAHLGGGWEHTVGISILSLTLALPTSRVAAPKEAAPTSHWLHLHFAPVTTQCFSQLSSPRPNLFPLLFR